MSATSKWIALALLGLAIAGGVAFAASRLVSEQIGIASESVSAGYELAPAVRSVAAPAGTGGGNDRTDGAGGAGDRPSGGSGAGPAAEPTGGETPSGGGESSGEGGGPSAGEIDQREDELEDLAKQREDEAEDQLKAQEDREDEIRDAEEDRRDD